MLRKSLRAGMLVSALIVSGSAFSQTLTRCDMCEVNLNRCITVGVLSYEQCMTAYQRCRADNCDAG